MSAARSPGVLGGPRRRRRDLSGLLANDQTLLGLLAASLLVRVLTDHLAPPESRHTDSLNVSGAIALAFFVVALGLLAQRRRGLRTAALAALFLSLWTGIALVSRGASGETLREGVREGSVLALGVIVYNARGVLSGLRAVRLVQLAGLAPAVLALYQAASGTGKDVEGNIRATGTFAHPNSAAMFFAIAAVASMWSYLENGRRPLDVGLAALFAAALVTTYSIDGLMTLLVMLFALGALHPTAPRARLALFLVAVGVLVAFFATPLGAGRIARESSSSLAATRPGEANSSLSWRLYKWRSLLNQWEQSPMLGRGLGTTTTAEGTVVDPLPGTLPHNEYMRYLVETGTVGLAILLWAVTVLVRRLWAIRRLRRADAAAASAAALALALIGGALVNSLADNTLLNSPTCYALALIVVAALTVPGAVSRSARDV